MKPKNSIIMPRKVYLNSTNATPPKNATVPRHFCGLTKKLTDFNGPISITKPVKNSIYSKN